MIFTSVICQKTTQKSHTSFYELTTRSAPNVFVCCRLCAIVIYELIQDLHCASSAFSTFKIKLAEILPGCRDSNLLCIFCFFFELTQSYVLINIFRLTLRSVATLRYTTSIHEHSGKDLKVLITTETLITKDWIHYTFR